VFATAKDLTVENVTGHTVKTAVMKKTVQRIVYLAPLARDKILKTGAADTGATEALLDNSNIFDIKLSPPKRWKNGAQVIREL
jgi:ABC-type Fe3+-hydroxamate transport system substrate-binding protein